MPAFYEEIERSAAGAATFRSNEPSQGPWSREMQHGGPPSALAVREMERLAPADGGHIARFALDFLAPVPVAPLTVRARVLKPGKRAQLLAAEITAGERTVLTARAWWRRQSPDIVPAVPDPADAQPLPEPESLRTGTPDDDLGRHLDYGWIAAMEFRYVSGHVAVPGPARVWVRPRVPLLAGEPTSPTQRAVLISDGSSGFSAVFDFRTHLFSNLDLNLSFLREPAGEWISLDANTSLDAAGGGTTLTRLGDRSGVFGYCMQALYVEPHAARG
jgi:acyl-coenzyme A thioesterase PaaI-like protein